MNKVSKPKPYSNSFVFDIITFSPLIIPIALKAGVNEESKGYLDLLMNIERLDSAISVPALHAQRKDYALLNTDVRDIRLFIWQDTNVNGFELFIHVYPNFIGVAEIRRCHTLETTSINKILKDGKHKSLEQEIQDFSEQKINDSFKKFHRLVESIYQNTSHPLLIMKSQVNSYLRSKDHGKAKILWTARTILFNKKQLEHDFVKPFIKHWLAKTMHPEDYQAIINCEKDYSMSWLNYILIDNGKKYQHFRLDAMRLSQYFYTAQDFTNQQLKRAISSAYVSDSLSVAQENLSHSRVSARLHLITYYDHLKYLTREKKIAVDEILNAWEFNNLIENGQRMVDVCSSKLDEANTKKQERSSFLTDLILVSLSFIAIIELALGLVEFSREMMSRPTLDYNDDDTSFILSYIANIDTDVMFGFSVVVAIILFILYRRIKIR